MPEHSTDTSGSTDPLRSRTAEQVIDGAGLYCSRLVAAGPLIFFGSTAVDERGALATDAEVQPPYHASPAAHAVAQSRYLFEQFDAGLTALGSGLGEIVQVEQFTPAKVYADGYITTRGTYLPERRPTTALAATGELLPREAVICSTGIATRPMWAEKEIALLPAGEEGGAINWAQLGFEYAGAAPYNDIVIAGPYVFVTGDVALDPKTGDIDPAAKVPDWIWAGSEARNEAGVLLRRLGERMEGLGASLADVVHVTMFLTDLADIYEIDRAWHRVFGDDPPARTVIPVRGVGVPRREGERLGHHDRAVKLEQQVRAVRPGHGVTRQVVTTPTGRLAHEAEVVRAGSLAWLSHTYAADEHVGHGLEAEVAAVLERVEERCTAAGGSIESLAQLRAFVRDPAVGPAVHARLRQLISAAPPVISVTGVPGPLLIPGASLFVDAVVHVQ